MDGHGSKPKRYRKFIMAEEKRIESQLTIESDQVKNKLLVADCGVLDLQDQFQVKHEKIDPES